MGYENQNSRARITARRTRADRNGHPQIEALTEGRDDDTMTARAVVRDRGVGDGGLSLARLSVKTRGGRYIRFTGHEARTLLRVLSASLSEA